MRISDWSSDVCSSDLLDTFLEGIAGQWRQQEGHKLKVLVLWRYNLLDPFGGQIPRFSNIEVTGLSFHRSKGLEADYTVLLDVSEGDYGVPSRIEDRSEEHTSELQSLMRISYAVFCLKKQN